MQVNLDYPSEFHLIFLMIIVDACVFWCYLTSVFIHIFMLTHHLALETSPLLHMCCILDQVVLWL
jgi:hypothetical protein